jgi:hypothetical protein
MKDQYVNDADFKDAFAHCLHGKPWGKISHTGRVPVSR